MAWGTTAFTSTGELERAVGDDFPGGLDYSSQVIPRRMPVRLGSCLSRVWVRSESILRCSRIPNYWQRGSTSYWPREPTAGEAAGAAPTPAEDPRAPSRRDHTGLPDLASRGSGPSPSPRCCPSPGSIDRLGTSAGSAQGPPGPRDRSRPPVRTRSRPTRHWPACRCTAEPRDSASRS